MTSRERITAALEHRPPDRTPIFEYCLYSPVADALLGRTYGGDPGNWPSLLDELGWEGAVHRSAADILDLAEALGHDMVYVLPNPTPPGSRDPDASPRPVPGPDPVENLQARNRYAAQCIPGDPDDAFLVYILLKERMDERGIGLPIIAPAYAHGVWTDVDLMQTMLIEPEVAHEHFRLASRRSLAQTEKYLALGIDQIGVGGDFSGTRLLISPECYRQFIVPEVRRVSRRVHEAGAWAINASDGDLWPVIDDFLLGCEVDGYLEIDMFAGMDLGRLKQSYGDRITLYGNLDCGNILSFTSPDEVARHTRRALEAGMGGGGHILCASNAISASVPLENYLAVIAAYRDMFGLPALALPS